MGYPLILISVLLLLREEVGKEYTGHLQPSFGGGSGAGAPVQRTEVRRCCGVNFKTLFSQGQSVGPFTSWDPESLRIQVFLGPDRSYNLCPALLRRGGSQGARNSSFGALIFNSQNHWEYCRGQRKDYFPFWGACLPLPMGYPPFFMFKNTL